MRILDTEAMRGVDRAAVEELGVPSLLLMENAALGVVEGALDLVPDAETVVVFCGPGNNGGDGLAIARHLAVRGLRARVLIVTGGRSYAGDARVQYEIARNMVGMGLELHEIGEGSPMPDLAELSAGADLAIDALFGSGLSRPLGAGFTDLVAAINGLDIPVVAVDLPSGLDADRAEPIGPHVEADLTVTFAAPQIAHIFPPAAAFVGGLVVSDLGVPSELVAHAPGDLHLLEAGDLAPLLDPRPQTAHKGDFGHLLVVGGSVGKSGAAILASRAAVRAGAGLVTAAVPEAILEAFEAGAVESMSVPLSRAPGDGLGETALASMVEAASGKDALAVGPGAGTDGETPATIRRFTLESELPMVLDADGLNAFVGALDTLAGRSAPTVLTPHPGELARLLGVETSAVVSDRLGSVRAAADRSASVVVLKGHLSLIADPDGGVYVNPTGNAGMATGGSGDVLTGVLGALLAQKLHPVAAAQLATFVHGLAGDLAAERIGEVSLAAGDLLDFVPLAFEVLAGRELASDFQTGEGAEAESEAPTPNGATGQR
ncbi:MAG: NAD(P)H-hydrate dehydratase [Thermoanaerobaculia bacterium]